MAQKSASFKAVCNMCIKMHKFNSLLTEKVIFFTMANVRQKRGETCYLVNWLESAAAASGTELVNLCQQILKCHSRRAQEQFFPLMLDF